MDSDDGEPVPRLISKLNRLPISSWSGGQILSIDQDSLVAIGLLCRHLGASGIAAAGTRELIERERVPSWA